MTFNEMITSLLKANPGLQQFEIVKLCGRTRKTRGSVTSALYRMKARGSVVQKGGGYYLDGGIDR